MLAADDTDPCAKLELRADRHQNDTSRIRALCLDLDATLDQGELDLGRVASLVEAIGHGMVSAPGGDNWSFLWTQYCRWHAWLAPRLAELAASLQGPSLRCFTEIYGPDLGRIVAPDAELEHLRARGLLRSDTPGYGQTSLGRILAVYLELEQIGRVLADRPATSERDRHSAAALLQQRLSATIRSISGSDRDDAASIILSAVASDTEHSETSRTLFAALSAAAEHDAIWDALSQQRQIAILSRPGPDDR